MPTLTRWFVKTAMIYLALSLLLGMGVAYNPLSGSGGFTGLFPVYLHLLVFGWLTQLIFGVAYWMFPKYARGPARGSETLGWMTYLLFNIGLLMRAAGELVQQRPPQSIWAWMLVVSALLQWLAVMLFIINIWPRVRGK